ANFIKQYCNIFQHVSVYNTTLYTHSIPLYTSKYTTALLKYITNLCTRDTFMPLRENNDNISLEDVLTIKYMYRDMIFTPLDKNSHMLLCICPYAYHNILTQLYINDTHYMHTPSYMTVQNILDTWHTYYTNQQFDRYFPWPRVYDLPYAYALPK